MVRLANILDNMKAGSQEKHRTFHIARYPCVHGIAKPARTLVNCRRPEKEAAFLSGIVMMASVLPQSVSPVVSLEEVFKVGTVPAGENREPVGVENIDSPQRQEPVRSTRFINELLYGRGKHADDVPCKESSFLHFAKSPSYESQYQSLPQPAAPKGSGFKCPAIL